MRCRSENGKSKVGGAISDIVKQGSHTSQTRVPTSSLERALLALAIQSVLSMPRSRTVLDSGATVSGMKKALSTLRLLDSVGAGSVDVSGSAVEGGTERGDGLACSARLEALWQPLSWSRQLSFRRNSLPHRGHTWVFFAECEPSCRLQEVRMVKV